MKKKLLLFAILCVIQLATFAQTQNFERKNVATANSELISVYPNPSSDYISLNNDENVKSIEIYSLVGRHVRSFNVEHTGERYDISDLQNSVYFVHIIGKINDKPLMTLRFTKKS